MGPVAGAQIVNANHKKTIGVDWLSWPNHVVPPADVRWILWVRSSYVMRCIEGMANQNGIALIAIELAVGFNN
jgi:hypothetical protein